jgi:ATP-dependent protease ClpP protease subunit
MLDKFKQAYGERAGDWRPIVVSLDSNGGLVEHGSQVITFILKMQATHNVDTLVEDKSRCASMCVPIYLAGSRRKAATGAKFMFHEVSFSRKVDEKLREVKAENPQLDIRKAKNYLVNVGTDNLFERYLKTAGASEKWMADMRRKVRGKDVWLSGRDLVEQRSGVVHGLL